MSNIEKLMNARLREDAAATAEDAAGHADAQAVKFPQQPKAYRDAEGHIRVNGMTPKEMVIDILASMKEMGEEISEDDHRIWLTGKESIAVSAAIIPLMAEHLADIMRTYHNRIAMRSIIRPAEPPEATFYVTAIGLTAARRAERETLTIRARTQNDAEKLAMQQLSRDGWTDVAITGVMKGFANHG